MGAVVLHCDSIGPTRWSHDGFSVSTHAAYQNNSSYYINPVKMNDSGEYTCYGMNSYGQYFHSSEMLLDVFGSIITIIV